MTISRSEGEETSRKVAAGSSCGLMKQRGAYIGVGVDAMRGVDVGITRIALFRRVGRPSGLSLRSLPPSVRIQGLQQVPVGSPMVFGRFVLSRHPLRPPDY